FAVTVSGIMPMLTVFSLVTTGTIFTVSFMYSLLPGLSRRVSQLSHWPRGIILVTLLVRRCGGQEEARSEGGSVAGVPDAEPAFGGGDRRGVHRLGLLRSARPGAGEVRDAAPGQRGGGERQLGRSGVRAVTAVLLSGGRGTGRGRPTGAVAGQAGTARGAQAHRRGDRAPAGACGFRSWAAFGRSGRGGGPAVRGAGASPLDRTGADPSPGVRSEPEKRLSRCPTRTVSGWWPTTSGCGSRRLPPGPTGGDTAGRCWPARAWPPGSPRGPPWTTRLTGTARRQQTRGPCPCPPHPRKEVSPPRPAVACRLPP